MYRKRLDGTNCSIARALDEVGEWWTLLIVRECAQGTSRFDEFQKELGIARNVLTGRLERLIEVGIVERYPLAERANTSGYRLTEKGTELFPVLVTLMQWGDKWLAPNGKARIAMVDSVSGNPVEPPAVRSKDGRSLTFRDIRYVRGPGATETTDNIIDSRNERVLGTLEQKNQGIFRKTVERETSGRKATAQN